MHELRFTNTDMSIDEILEEHKKEIYENVMASIKANYINNEIDEINVVQIYTRKSKYYATLSKKDYVTVLNKCISFFVELEMYEQCQECLNIINDIEKKISENINGISDNQPCN